MKPSIRYPLILLLLLWLPGVQADALLPSAVVDPAWLKSHVNDAGLVLLDIQQPPQFARHHLPNAISFPFSQWRTDAKGKPPKSLLPLDELATRLGKLGISAQSPILIIATGNGVGDLSAAARVFWSLKVLGHQQVAILNGGLVSYVNDQRGGYVSGPASAKRPATRYEAKPQPGLLATSDWLKDADMPRLDARSLGEHIGLVGGGKGQRPGTLPGAHHLPFDWLSDDQSARLRSTEQLRALFDYAGLDNQAAVHFCQSGNRAALTWFVDYAVLGHEDARLYDGSMMEWGRDANLPIEQRLSLP